VLALFVGSAFLPPFLAPVVVPVVVSLRLWLGLELRVSVEVHPFVLEWLHLCAPSVPVERSLAAGGGPGVVLDFLVRIGLRWRLWLFGFPPVPLDELLQRLLG
jgi:hypothetical protein